MLITWSITGHSQSYPLIQNSMERQTMSLDGKWHYILDPYETGYYDYRYKPYDASEKTRANPAAYYNNAKARTKSDRIEYDFDASPTLQVPGDWNSQDDKLLYYEGTVWLKRSFDYEKKSPVNRVFIYFGAINYEAEVYLNGTKLGTHIGGFTPFNFEVTGIIREKDNYLVVKADNTRSREAVPTVNTDWWNYGGITRHVKVLETPPTFVRDYTIQLSPENDQQIDVSILMDGVKIPERITLSIPELGITARKRKAKPEDFHFSIDVDKLEKWSPENPKLYTIQINAGADQIRDRIGFRTIEVKGRDIFLNGESIFLRGICMHEENPAREARAFSREDAVTALGWAKELNSNFMRLAHYPHNEEIVRLADEMGMLLWKEIPVYWTIDFTNEQTQKNASNQLTEMIARDKNRASVIIWSMANETPESDVRNAFLKKMIAEARSLDPTRLISAALQHRTIDGVHHLDDALTESVDIISFNQYIGWYGGDPNELPDQKWAFAYEKPVVISEFGAGALAGYYGDKGQIWTENYQAHLYEKTLQMVRNMPEVRGISPWILADFRSPKRNLPVIQDGWNRKGVVANNGHRKMAFHVLREFYEEIEQTGHESLFSKLSPVSKHTDNAHRGYVTPKSYDGWELFWADEFSGNSLNKEWWTPVIGNGCPELCGFGNKELQYYTEENMEIADGLLTIHARRDTIGDNFFSSSRIMTRDKVFFKFGRVDIRAKLPFSQGLWPALWMMGQNHPEVGWPHCGEIDIMELRGSIPNKVGGNIHYSNLNNRHQSTRASYHFLDEGTYHDRFHVFSLVWNEDRADFFVNDVLFKSVDLNELNIGQKENAFHKDFYLLINCAIGGHYGGDPDETTVWPQQMQVDYVRVFQQTH
jgi:beta-glucuronidase